MRGTASRDLRRTAPEAAGQARPPSSGRPAGTGAAPAEGSVPDGALRVTFVALGQPRMPSGSHRVTYEYANQLAGRGHAVTIVHVRQVPVMEAAWGPWSRRVRAVRALWRRWGSAAPGWFALDPRVRLLSVPSPDGVHLPAGDAVVATHWSLAEYLTGYGADRGSPLYLIHHRDGLGGYAPERVDATWRLPVRKLAVSLWSCEVGRGMGIEDVFHLPNGIDHALYRLLRPVEGRPPRVAMAFTPRAIKDPETGLRALALARERFPALQAVLFGVARRDPAIPSWVEYHRNPPDRQVVEIYNRSAAFLCSSRVEGFGLPGAEAMACGAAVVSTDCGGVRDYAVHDETALLAEPGDAAGLAEQLCAVLGDDALRCRLARSGLERIRGFSWERSAGLFEQHLLSAGRTA